MPKWHKLHSQVVLDPRLLAHPAEVGFTYSVLLARSEDDGIVADHLDDLALTLRISRQRLDEIIVVLRRLGHLADDDSTLTVASQAEDHVYALSRAAGGVARRDAHGMPKRCTKDARRMQTERPASASGTSGRASGSSGDTGTSGASGRLVSDFWCAQFERVRGAPYAWEGKSHGSAMKRVLLAAKGDVADVQSRIERFLADPFWGPKADFLKFASQFNAMAGPPRSSDPFDLVAAEFGRAAL